jgi:hypothetical protein
MQRNQLLMIGGGLVAVLIAGGVIAKVALTGKDQAPADSGQQKKRIAEPVNVLPVTDRPVVTLSPAADGHNVSITVSELKKPATEVEYELEYQAGSLLQGAFGNLELGALPASKQLLLGSCSAGGACTFHEDVQGGTLLMRFSGPENYALKSEWRYFDNKTKETALSSKDAKFQISSPALAAARYVIIYNSPGFPAGLKGTPVSDPYSLVASSTLTGDAELTMRATEEGALKLMGWDGKAWQEFTGTVDGKSVTAKVKLLPLYILVK